jgi:hypothetical protein
MGLEKNRLISTSAQPVRKAAIEAERFYTPLKVFAYVNRVSDGGHRRPPSYIMPSCMAVSNSQ